MIQKIGNWIIDHPAKCIIPSIVLMLLLISNVRHLQSDFGMRNWFRTTDPLIKELNAFEKKFGNDEMLVIAVQSKRGIINRENLKILHEITEESWQLPDIVRVDSLTNYNYSKVDGDSIDIAPFYDPDEIYTDEKLEYKKQIANTERQIRDQFLSRDGNTAVIYGTLRTRFNISTNYRHIVESLMKQMEKYDEISDLTFHYAGDAIINDSYRKVSDDDLAIMLPLNFAIMIFLLILIFQTIEGVLIPIGLVGFSILGTFGISGLLGLKFDNMSAAIPGILISICMADSIHIIATYYRLLNKLKDKQSAAKEAIRKNFTPTLLTSISTMIGFLSLTQTELIPIRKLGILAAFGTMMAWLLSMLVVCPILPLLPARNFQDRMKFKFSSSTIQSYIHWVNRHKNKIIVAAFFLSGTFLFIGLQNKVNSDPLSHFSKKLKVSKDSNFLINTFNGIGGPQIVVDSGSDEGIKDPNFLKNVQEFIDYIESHQFVNKVSSSLDIIKQLNMNLHENSKKYFAVPDSKEKIAQILFLYSMSLPQGMDLNNQISIDNRFMRLSVMWSLQDAENSLYQIENFKKKAEELNLNISVTGKHFMYHRMIGYIVKTFFISISLAIIFISILMLIVLKSKLLAFLSMLPNLFPLIFGSGLMFLMGQHIDISTSLVISVCLGIAVDDTIHFLGHFSTEYRQNSDVFKSVHAVFTHTAPALIFTTVVLAIGFGVFAFANFIPNVNFGILCSVILSVALLTDLLLLPALLLRFLSKRPIISNK